MIGGNVGAYPLHDGSVSSGSVFQAFTYTADGGGAHACLAADIGVARTRGEHLGGLEALGNVQDLLDGTGVLKEGVAFLHSLEGQDGFKKRVHVGIMKRLHGIVGRGVSAISFITLVW